MWNWYKNPKTQYWYRSRSDDWLLSNRIGQDGGRGYQVQLQDFVRSHFENQSSRTAIDVGANIGITAIEYAEIFDHVVAFEPIPDVYQQLTMTLERNEISNVETHCLGCGNEAQKVRMLYRPNNSFATKRASQGNVDAEIITIDSLGLEQVDFIKIDVEGMEGHVVDGAWQTIKRDRPVIQFEYKKNLLKRQTQDIFSMQIYIDALENLGYDIIDKRGTAYKKSKQKDLFAIPYGGL